MAFRLWLNLQSIPISVFGFLPSTDHKYLYFPQFFILVLTISKFSTLILRYSDVYHHNPFFIFVVEPALFVSSNWETDSDQYDVTEQFFNSQAVLFMKIHICLKIFLTCFRRLFLNILFLIE